MMIDIADDIRKPNWLFRGLIVISLLVHLVLFMHLANVFRPKSFSYIELTMRSMVKPVTREIPQPRTSKEHIPLPANVRPQEIQTQKAPSVKPLPQVPTDADYPLNAPAPVQPPHLPSVADVKVAEWQPPAEAVEAPPAPPSHQPAVTKEQYRSTVKRKIVDRIGNNYPPRAKKRNLQGRVVASIVIGTDGKIVALEIVQSSGHRILDQFVIREVKAAAPFARPPDGPVKVIVPIRFQLQ